MPLYLLFSPAQVYDSDYLNCQPTFVSTLSLSRLCHDRQGDCRVERTVWRLPTVRLRTGYGFSRGSSSTYWLMLMMGRILRMEQAVLLIFPPLLRKPRVQPAGVAHGEGCFTLCTRTCVLCVRTHRIWSLFQPDWICSESAIDLSWWYFDFQHTSSILMTVLEEAACCLIDLVSHVVYIVSTPKTTEKFSYC